MPPAKLPLIITAVRAHRYVRCPCRIPSLFSAVVRHFVRVVRQSARGLFVYSCALPALVSAARRDRDCCPNGLGCSIKYWVSSVSRNSSIVAWLTRLWVIVHVTAIRGLFMLICRKLEMSDRLCKRLWIIWIWKSRMLGWFRNNHGNFVQTGFGIAFIFNDNETNFSNKRNSKQIG